MQRMQTMSLRAGGTFLRIEANKRTLGSPVLKKPLQADLREQSDGILIAR